MAREKCGNGDWTQERWDLPMIRLTYLTIHSWNCSTIRKLAVSKLPLNKCQCFLLSEPVMSGIHFYQVSLQSIPLFSRTMGLFLTIQRCSYRVFRPLDNSKELKCLWTMSRLSKISTNMSPKLVRPKVCNVGLKPKWAKVRARSGVRLLTSNAFLTTLTEKCASLCLTMCRQMRRMIGVQAFWCRESE